MNDNPYKIALISGFIGATLAFVLTRFGDFLNRVKKRNVQNLNALVKLEHLTNEYQAIVNDNKENMDAIESAIKRPNALPLNRLKVIAVDKRAKLHLLDIKLINKVVAIEYNLRRFNDDADMINYHLNEFQRAVLRNTLSPAQYKMFISGLIGEATNYQAFIDDFLNKLMELTAYVQLKEGIDTTWTIKILNILVHFGKREPTTGEIKTKKKKILGDLNKSRENSIKEKAAILSRAKR